MRLKTTRIFATISFLGMFGMGITSSCKKSTFKSPPVTSFTLVNAVTGGKSVKLGSNVSTISNNSYAQLSIAAGDNNLYIWPADDSSNPYFTYQKFNAEERRVYSLFLAGTITGVDGILVKEDFPYHEDSTCGIRIINLSPNSPSINVTLSSSPTINEFSNVTYKQYTNFKLYPAKAYNSNYEFQIRRALDNSLLFSYVLNTPRFANVTLVIRGLAGSSPALGITRVNNDR